MDEINLLNVCLNAFVAVMALLSLLSLAIRGLIAWFPERAPDPPDAAIPAAINEAVHQWLPGARVTRIEPEPSRRPS
ncbi:MAG TPA: hypothetical protein PKE26_04940 [Kiritimatiellia bacterium]|nr:hypothetical protein [Kiritimatiellia bacterium]HMO98437.1 hypothetical protein [Kiritimatiellia bacterium]